MKNIFFTLIITFFISGCSSLSLSTDYDRNIDFSSFKTFRWHPTNQQHKTSVQAIDHIMDQRIRATIEQQLSHQNYAKAGTDSEQVDLLINYSFVIEDRSDIQTYNNYYGMYPGYPFDAGYGFYGRHTGFAFNPVFDTLVTHYKQGTLIIDIISPITNKLMWRGSADGRLPTDTNRKARDRLVNNYVSRILRHFPPKN